MDDTSRRRAFLVATGAALVTACQKNGQVPVAAAATGSTPPDENRSSTNQQNQGKDAEDVSATEDLMREHGAIRRVLIVYREAAARLRAKAGSVPPDPLQQAAQLMRSFAEEYHEKKLEETHIFPALAKAGGPLAATVSTLIAQHRRGREITESILAMTQKTVSPQAAEPLARSLEAFARMYELHAAIEDTVIFPAWKKALTPKELDAMGDRFEDIEHETFGKDGFEAAVAQVGSIEKALGIDLDAWTAPPPPRA
ncbi:MAG: hemerythrin domain-containing protein [Polyangiaceae bacterium]|nr:hemerythrin domain-containing protein [Polyangiaceae bacterium]